MGALERCNTKYDASGIKTRASVWPGPAATERLHPCSGHQSPCLLLQRPVFATIGGESIKRLGCTVQIHPPSFNNYTRNEGTMTLRAVHCGGVLGKTKPGGEAEACKASVGRLEFRHCNAYQ